jgi:GWxTD domain-containing protein
MILRLENMKISNRILGFKSFTTLAFLVILLSATSLSAQGKRLNAFLSYAAFYSPVKGPYIETYLTVEGTSVNFIKNANGKYQATIQVIMLFKKGAEIANYDKYELNSPEVDDTTSVNFSFIDQQRYTLANGEYEFEIQIWDKNSDSKPFINLQPLVVDFPADKVCISGIELLASYSATENPGILTKNGYDLVPYIFNYYPEKIGKITFYAEIYNTLQVLGEGEKYLLTYYLEASGHDKPLSKFVSQKRETSAPVNILFSEFDISGLPTGNYNLVIEAKDKQNNLIGLNRIFIMRNNPKVQIKFDDISQLEVENTFVNKINSVDTLREYIKYLEPIAFEQEKNFAQVHLLNSDLKTLQKFFYKFWIDRDELDPERAWLNYLSEVNKVNVAYTTSIYKGYESDRGRVYLKYGPPNAISESYNEPATYPYEIWHYYVIKDGQRNKKFVFYTKDMVTNDFTLLHSDVTGELSNYRWQQVLYSRVDAGFNLDKGVTEDAWGGNSKKYFDLPR